jgi:NADPH:quinone reductase
LVTIAVMRAVVISRFGEAEALEVTERPIPRPAAGQISIDVEFASANYAEVLYRRGVVDVDLPFVPGIEVAGRVREIGDGVDGFAIGQPVAALTIVDSGGYAEVVVTDPDLGAPLPPEPAPDLARLAGASSNSTTALLVFDQVARLREGESVLVHAAAGGVGSQLGQAARLLGASRVAGTVGRPEQVETALAFGHDEVIVRDDLERRLAEIAPDGFDVVVDPVGGAMRSASYAALALGGRLVAMGNASAADDVQFGANELWFASKAILGFNLAALSGSRAATVGAALRRAVGWVLDGRMRVEITDELPLVDAAEAHRRIESGASTGKIVLRVAG